MSGQEEKPVEYTAPCKEELSKLHQVCVVTFDQSFEAGREAKIATIMQFSSDFGVWLDVLSDRPESGILSDANKELTLALLSLTHGQYRNAFKGLRLVLELILQSVYLSTNLVDMQEWFKNERHTSWTQLVNDENGPLGIRFCRAFYPSLKEHRKNMLSVSSTLYTELSETIHGNTPMRIPIPDSMEFNDDVFNLWLDKFESVKLIIHFTLCMRYLMSLDNPSRNKLVDILNEELGHLAEVRVVLGGVE